MHISKSSEGVTCLHTRMPPVVPETRYGIGEVARWGGCGKMTRKRVSRRLLRRFDMAPKKLRPCPVCGATRLALMRPHDVKKKKNNGPRRLEDQKQLSEGHL